MALVYCGALEPCSTTVTLMSRTNAGAVDGNEVVARLRNVGLFIRAKPIVSPRVVKAVDGFRI